jgi:hypothetical protein
MFELKWTDQDMIDFANSCSVYDIDDRQLSDFAEGKRQQALKERVDVIVDMVAMKENLIDTLEKALKKIKK